MKRYLIWVNFVEVNIRRKSFRGRKMTKFQQKLVTFLWRSFSGKFLIAEISSSKISCRKVFSESTLQRCSYKRMLWKHAANLLENIHGKRDFNKVAKHGCSLVNLLHICCILATDYQMHWRNNSLYMNTEKMLPDFLSFSQSTDHCLSRQHLSSQ